MRTFEGTQPTLGQTREFVPAVDGPDALRYNPSRVSRFGGIAVDGMFGGAVAAGREIDGFVSELLGPGRSAASFVLHETVTADASALADRWPGPELAAAPAASVAIPTQVISPDVWRNQAAQPQLAAA